MKIGRAWRIWLTAFGIALLLVVATSLSTFSLYDVNVKVAEITAKGPGGVLYTSKTTSAGGGLAPTPMLPPTIKHRILPYSWKAAEFTITDGRVGDIPDILVQVQEPHDPEFLGNITLHEAGCEYHLYGWELYGSIAITASPRVTDTAYDEWAWVEVHLSIRSRVGYVFLEAYVRNCSIVGSEPNAVASEANFWYWTTELNYKESIGMAPNSNIPTVEDVMQYDRLEDAMNAYNLSKGVTLVFSVKIVPTVVKARWLGKYAAAPTTIVVSYAIRIVHVVKVTPTQPQGREDIEEPIIEMEGTGGVPWWAWWSIAVLVLIGVILVVVKTIPAAVARAVKARG